MITGTGNGIKMSTVLATGFLGLAAVVGLSVGLGIEGRTSAIREDELSRLRREIKTVEDITRDINVTPPNGFIN